MTEGTPKLHKLSHKESEAVAKRLAYFEGSSYWKYQRNCAELRDYRFGKQWTEAELKEREKNGKETITLNRTRKILNTIVGKKVANKPKYTIVPHTQDDHTLSMLYEKLLDTSFYASLGLETLSNIVMYGDGDNIGYFFVSMNNDNIPTFEALDYSQVVVDPSSTDSLFRDATCIYIKRWIPIESAKILYGIDDFDTSLPNNWNESRNYSSATGTDYDLPVNHMIDSSITNVKIYEGYEPYIEAHEGSIRKRIRKVTIVGYNYTYTEVLPPTITDIPIVPYYTDFVPNPYRVGEGHYIKELNDIINSSINITMVDGDIESWKEAHNNGDRYFMIKPDRKGTTPHTVQGLPLNQAWFGLLNFFLTEQEIEGTTTQTTSYGDSSTHAKPDLLGKMPSILDAMKLSMLHLDSALSQVGRITIQYYKTFVDKDTVLYITGGESSVKRYTIARDAGLDLDDPNSVARYRSYRLRNGDNPNQINLELAQARADKKYFSSLRDVYNPLNSDTVDIHVVPSSYTDSFELEQFNRLMTMRKAGLHIDDEFIIKKSPVDNSNMIAERASLNHSLMTENEQYRHLVEELKARVTQLEGIVSQGKMDSVSNEHKYKLKKRIDDTNNKAYVRKKVEGLLSRQAVKDIKTQGQAEIALLREKLKVLEVQATNNATDKSDQDQSIIDLLR